MNHVKQLLNDLGTSKNYKSFKCKNTYWSTNVVLTSWLFLKPLLESWVTVLHPPHHFQSLNTRQSKIYLFIYLFHGNLKMQAGNLLKFLLLSTSLLSLSYLHYYNILTCKFMFVTLSLYMLRFDNISKYEGIKPYNLWQS